MGLTETKMGKKPKLLIIDDSELILEILEQFFETKGYAIHCATNGLDGLKLIEKDPGDFDLIITDIVMPNISGVGIISIVKRKYPEIPVIAITGLGEHPETLAAEANADFIFEKPIDFKKLDRIIDSLLADG